MKNDQEITNNKNHDKLKRTISLHIPSPTLQRGI